MNPVLVELTRGHTVESVHRGAIAISDARGRLVAHCGDIDLPIFPRSAFKSLQALPLIETGAASAFGVGDEELALACASHSSEPFHVERVAAWLERIGCRESDLACGAHMPSHEPSAHALIRAGERPCRLHNNCSGKHTGFLTLARHLKLATEAYERPDHPAQKIVRDVIAEMCGVSPSSMPVGIDGCSAPNYAIPLQKVAYAMARLADPSSLTPTRANAAARLVNAWRTHPHLVSGTGRACADISMAAKGETVVKIGAEGYYVAVIPERGFGVALKIDDGASRAAEAAIAQVLVWAGVVDEDAPSLQKYLHPSISSWRGETVGHVRVKLNLEPMPGKGGVPG